MVKTFSHQCQHCPVMKSILIYHAHHSARCQLFTQWQGYVGTYGDCCPQAGQDGPLAKAINREGIYEIFDVTSLSKSDYDDLSYALDDGSEATLSIGHKGMLHL